jgi:hypothetical protein
MFDLVVAVAEGQSYKSIFADTRNGVSGKLGNINIDVPVTDKNNGVEMTTFVFTVQDSLSGDEIALDNYKMSFFDLDINKAENLHEQLCIDKDQFSQSVPFLPQGSDVKVFQLKDMGCDMKPSQSGAVVLQSQGVGFLCDNPVDSTDLSQVNCTQCFNKQQCLKTKNSQYFPLNRAGRVATFTLTSSTFKISLGINCKKSVGETCNRNFVFSGSYEGCAPSTTAAPTTLAPTTAAPTTA